MFYFVLENASGMELARSPVFTNFAWVANDRLIEFCRHLTLAPGDIIRFVEGTK
jgi:DNA-binding Xre family transcriptional regulator